jgi:2-aminoethylphosphonate-pyruvate transaminase
VRSQAILLSVANPPLTTRLAFTSPEAEVGGQTLVGRLLRTLATAGIDEAVVVGAVDPRGALDAAGEEAGLEVTFVEVPPDTPDGLMLLCARPHVRGRALCLSTAHVVGRDFLAALEELEPDESPVLAVDSNLTRAPDLQRLPRVSLTGNRVARLGRDLEAFQALSTGVLRTAPSIFTELARQAEPRIDAALERLAAGGLLKARDIGAALWQLVTTPGDRLHAEWMLRLFGDDLGAPPVLATTPTGDPHRTLDHIRAVLAEKEPRHYVLLNPGPVNTTARVKSALVHNDVCHRDADYADVVRRIERKLKRVFRAGPEHTVVVLTGSGTAAMEASISSSVPPGGRLLVVDNGAFGARQAEVAQVHKIPTTVLRSEWGTLPDVAALEAALVADPAIAAVAVIHHETSVGLLNPIGAIGAICRRLGRLLLVDTVSSLGGEDVDVTRDHIDVCYSSANKCLHAVSGISFVCVHERVWQRIADTPPRVYYLDLNRYRRYLAFGETPFTPAVSTFFALDVALDELLAEGEARRHQRYVRWNQRLRTRLGELGCEPFTDSGHESCTITTARLPAGVSFERLYGRLKARGYIIYNCKDALKDRYFQVANMGDLTDETIERFLTAFTESLSELAAPVEREAVNRVRR